MQKKLERNIIIDYTFRFVSCFDLSSAIWVIYLVYKGLPLWQIGILEGLFHTVSFISEVPTGAIADIIGRKRAIIISRICSTLSSVLILLSHDLWFLILGFVLSALGYNFLSGSEEALVYDSLKELGKSDSYLKINGRLELILNISQSISVLVGGILSNISFAYCYLTAIMISIISLIPCLLFTEPCEIRRKNNKRITLSEHFNSAFFLMKEDSRIARIILSYSIIFTLYMISYFYGQEYFSQLGLRNDKIGFLMFFVGALNCLGAVLSEKMVRMFGGYIKIICFFIIALGTIGVSLCNIYIAILCFGIMGFASTMLYPIQSEELNVIIPSEQRATIISVNSMIFSMYMLVLFPLAGAIGDKFGLKNVFIGLAVIELILALLFLLKNRYNTYLNLKLKE